MLLTAMNSKGLLEYQTYDFGKLAISMPIRYCLLHRLLHTELRPTHEGKIPVTART